MLIKLIARIIIGLLWVRFVLKLFAVAGTGIILTLYRVTGALISPFQNIFPSIVFEGRFVIEINTLFAIVIYALIEFILVKVFARRYRDGY